MRCRRGSAEECGANSANRAVCPLYSLPNASAVGAQVCITRRNGEQSNVVGFMSSASFAKYSAAVSLACSASSTGVRECASSAEPALALCMICQRTSAYLRIVCTHTDDAGVTEGERNAILNSRTAVGFQCTVLQVQYIPAHAPAWTAAGLELHAQGQPPLLSSSVTINRD